MSLPQPVSAIIPHKSVSHVVQAGRPNNDASERALAMAILAIDRVQSLVTGLEPLLEEGAPEYPIDFISNRLRLDEEEPFTCRHVSDVRPKDTRSCDTSYTVVST